MRRKQEWDGVDLLGERGAAGTAQVFRLKSLWFATTEHKVAFCLFISAATSIQLCMFFFILAGCDEIRHGLWLRNCWQYQKSQMDWSAQSFLDDLTISQLDSMQSHRSSEPEFVPLPGPRRSGYICGSPTLVCSGQQDCLIPIAFLFSNHSSLPPLSFSSTWDLTQHWHFILSKRAAGFRDNLAVWQKEMKRELTSRVLTVCHSVFWRCLSPFSLYCAM